ncbi:sulfatase family protein [Cupriavidus taiwanensis]|uniref:sulfatase family protein n=1 Tax=Cupriavidus taiwanensis TaxID=164546 RepID=UPI000E10E7C5|nr:sulfatase [Cupriavidus taiwanensis]SOY67096.1 Sulfatase [Cupriavidus taiwanensis]SOY67162.1 Sulfatase [Cupriavidus taiwanensis]SOY94819.1 Sulfatase [Cupriavidus taiwanensis]SOZ71732.1 Sulfatase [Cupriavidus taiwanensis]SOZ86977.1 Sulfatase [Cupriavidus taiwanensis]
MNVYNRTRNSLARLSGAVRLTMHGVALLVAAQSGLLHAQTQGENPNKPNILWITVEDITTFVGAYGDREVKTPNIDQLAREGVLYTHAYQTAGVCAPARAALITGMYPTSVGAHHMRTGPGEIQIPGRAAPQKPEGIPATYSVVLPEQVKAFPEYLRKAGYYTTNNQKQDYQFEAPVTVWDENGPSASYRNRPKGKPFFSVFNFFLTHESMVALRKDPLLEDPARVSVPPIFPDTAAARGDIARMYTNIELMDRQVGELIQMLKDDGLYDNTIIFFFADNGGNLPWMKREILERGTHVPFIVRSPGGLPAGTRRDELVSGVDLAPTVLSLAGVPVPGYMQGQAFLGEQRASIPRRYVFAARDRMDTEYDRVRMVRDQRYRYLYNYMPELPYYQDLKFRMMLPMMRDILKHKGEGSLPPATAAWFKTKPVEELYDAEQDPWELHNLAEDPRYKGKLEELRQAFRAWTAKYGDMGGVPEREMLSQMWLGGSAPPATAAPVVQKAGDGVRITCATAGASIGYWIERPAAMPAVATHVVQSWDYERLAGELLGKGFAKVGDKRPVPPSWNVYDGEVIPLRPGEILHVNAMRIGYTPAQIDYVDGSATVQKAP